MSPKSLKITIFSSLTRNLAKYIFFTQINFLFKFSIIQIFLIMCNVLVMCNLHMICKMPIFSYFSLKSNIHHVSNITLFIHIIKINVNSNYFELTSIVHIIGQNSIKMPFFTISQEIMQIFPPTTIGGITHLFPLISH